MRSLFVRMQQIRWLSIAALGGSIMACGSTKPVEPVGMTPVSIDISGAYSLSAGPEVTQSADGRVSYRVIIANRAASSVTASYSDCWAFLQLFSESNRKGSPVYDEGALGASCVAGQRTASIAAGDSLVLTRQVPTSFLIGVPSGHYFSAIRVAPNGSETVLPSGALDFHAP